MPPTLVTMNETRELDHEDLLKRSEASLAEYDRPAVETQAMRLERLSRTLDEVPQIYRWFLQLQSWCDHWTVFASDQFTQKSPQYKRWRQRRDLFKDMASAAKMRYESASRQITVLTDFDATGMPRSRRA